MTSAQNKNQTRLRYACYKLNDRTDCCYRLSLWGFDAGLTQAELSEASGIRRQTISRMEACGPKPIVSRDRNVVPVLAALGRHGVMMQRRGVALVQSAGNANPSPVQNKTPAAVRPQQGWVYGAMLGSVFAPGNIHRP
jgi:hypothetical protein